MGAVPLHRRWNLTRGLVALLLASLVIATCATTARAADPRISTISPKGGQRGTTVDVILPGSRLADVKQLLFTTPGLTYSDLSFDGDKGEKAHAKIIIAADCPQGIHGVFARTESGISNVLTFHVGSLPEMVEVEPNSDFAVPQAIPLGTVVNGRIDSEDVDYFMVEAKKGERISVEIEGLRLGRTFFDPYIAILDLNRFELSGRDDAALLRQDSVCSILAPADGKYVIEVRETSFAGSGDCSYRLHVGKFPRPTGVLPAGGKPGETLDVTWLGDPAGPRTEKVTLPTSLVVGQAGIFCKDPLGEAPSWNPIRLSDLPNTIEAEPNDDPAQATVAQAPGALNGVIGQKGDVDRFKFTTTKGQAFHIKVYARELRSQLDSVLTVSKVGGGTVGSNDDNGEPDSYLRFQAPEDGEYLVEIKDHLGVGGPDFFYRVEIEPIKPQLSMKVLEREQYQSLKLTVAKGNRTAFLVGANRTDFGGAVDFDLAGLPPGVTVEKFQMPGDRPDVPVLLTAAPDAAPAGALVEINGKSADPNAPCEGRLRQQHSLVRGQNNRDVWSFYTDRVALAVTNEVPFSIEIVPPKAPIVQNGSMNLKVVAKRAEGFKAPIRIALLYNPNGISSSGSVNIEEGKTEAAIPLTAAGNATVQTCKIAVIAQADVSGNVIVSSQLVDLSVAAPYLAFKFEKAAVEQGQETDLVVKVEKLKDFAGAAHVELQGLPGGTTTVPLDFAADATQIAFHIKAAADARVGKHTSLNCQVVITENGEPVPHSMGGGELQIDTPLPPKNAAAKPAEAAPMPAAVAAAPVAKPLSRLEKLRLENGGK